MSDGLGTTITPGGEIGTITHAVPLQAETTPDNPAQISQTTAIQTLDQLLTQNWILSGTFTVSTSMPPGTILYIKKIHPYECNWPNRHVAQMFNTWTGSLKLQYRPVATAWYGGSIRVGFLPPNLTESQVREMPLEMLTSYPNCDIDPKNTTWVDFRGPDQREIAYHYFSDYVQDDPNRQQRQGFGGYIVFYNASWIVTQSPDFKTISFMIQTAGDFMYDQPNPSALTPIVGQIQPLGSSYDLPISLQPLCDSMDTGFYNSVQINAVSITSLLAGGFQMSAIGLKDAVGQLDTLKMANDTQLRYYRSGRANSAWAATLGGGNTPEITVNETNILPHINVEANGSTKTSLSIYNVTSDFNYQHITHEPSGDGKCHWKITDGVATSAPMGRTTVTTVHDLDDSALLPINPVDCNADMILQPMAGGESIVSFVNLYGRTMSPQLATHAYHLGKWPTAGYNGTLSYLYNLVSENGTPLLTLRLNPNGMWTTTPVTTTVLYPGTCSLHYLQTLDISSPLPGPTAAQRSYAHEARKLIKKGKTFDRVNNLITEFSTI
jgi:hypothetical protein